MSPETQRDGRHRPSSTLLTPVSVLSHSARDGWIERARLPATVCARLSRRKKFARPFLHQFSIAHEKTLLDIEPPKRNRLHASTVQILMRSPNPPAPTRQGISTGNRPAFRVTCRRGVTLLELIVVLLVIAMSATLVIPALKQTMSGDDSINAELELLTQARRLATQRGEPLQLRVAGDGVWAVVSVRAGDVVSSGRSTASLSWLPNVRIDAVGTCMLGDGVAPPPNAKSWDAVGCRWRMETATP